MHILEFFESRSRSFSIMQQFRQRYKNPFLIDGNLKTLESINYMSTDQFYSRGSFVFVSGAYLFYPSKVDYSLSNYARLFNPQRKRAQSIGRCNEHINKNGFTSEVLPFISGRVVPDPFVLGSLLPFVSPRSSTIPNSLWGMSLLNRRPS